MIVEIRKVKDVYEAIDYIHDALRTLSALDIKYQVDLEDWEVIVKLPQYMPYVKKGESKSGSQLEGIKIKPINIKETERLAKKIRDAESKSGGTPHFHIDSKGKKFDVMLESKSGKDKL
jgi:hypothetical protein